MNTKTKLALWGMILLFSFSFAGTKNGENANNEEKPFVVKTLKNYAARHNLSSAQYQTEVTKFHKAGYKLTYVDGYYVNGKIKFAALWKKGKTSTLIARHNLTSKQYQDEVTKNHKNGYRLIHVDGYSNGKKARYAAIWNKQSTSGLRARHGLTGTKYTAEFKKNQKDGYRLVHISGYGIKGKAYYAAIWKKGNPSGYVARHGLTSKQYQDLVVKYWKQGFRVTQVDSYDVGNKTYYACIMEKKSGKYSARHGMNSKNYQLQVDNHYYQGYVPISVSGHDAGKSSGYAAAFKNVTTWKSSDTNQLDAKIKKVMKDFKVPGVTIGIVKDGRLVYAKGYGYGNKEDKTIASATSLMRLASVSKPITSVAIMKLVEQNKLKLSDKVLGRNSILGSKYGSKALGNWEKAITVQQLLEHTAGGDTWDNNMKPEGTDTWSAPMFQKKDLSQPKLIGWVLDNRNPSHKPGTRYQYSNYGYCLLGRIIEKKTGKSYESYLRNNILKQCGISQIYIGANEKKKRKYKEVVYYANGGNAYSLQMRRMDSHGGLIASSVDLLRFMVRVDGQNSKKDILKSSTITTMTKGSSANGSYAKGWAVSGGNWSHGGGMGGTSTFIKKMDNGVSYVFLTNSTGNGAGQAGAMKKALEDGIKAIKFWPNLDLF
ncbi:serine hydrolase [Kordia sp. YSTF-M3]|uniref:Serine hydrolase n=1 Tax=Kordia aestuariivivens TaxID=2759037 RepID=A0ABR7Q779_9FLAO|nr:serine hydrolase [Kordia aestuariivivens]MBC8754427.1 serine hydrolase [Kordia aestuariivivens]